ncbi:MAG: hypothetical protein WED04_02175 [Promethearchaeati archaeon SRVP18_Atabeyarchaeia-1]
MRMGKENYSESRGRVTVRTLIPPVAVAFFSMLFVLLLTLFPSFRNIFSPSATKIVIVFLMWLFFASTLVTLADFREMQGTISGWLDVLVIILLEGLLGYLVFADLLYVSILVVLCGLFVAYVSFAQRD